MEGELNFHDIEKKAIDQDTKVESLSSRLSDDDIFVQFFSLLTQSNI